MIVRATIILLVLIVELALLSEGRKSKVYVGTGVNGNMETSAGSDRVVLGGLFRVRFPESENEKCGAVFGPSIQRVEAMALATQMINNIPSILPGVILAFEIRETCAETNKALEETLYYVSERNADTFDQGISGVVGAVLSSVSISVARLLRLFKIPQISFASTANILSDKTIFDYFLRTVPPDSLQARAMADIVEYFNWTYVIAMHTGDIYGREGIQAFITELQKRKMCTAMSSIEVPADATATDFDIAIEKLNQEWVHNATVVVLFGQQSTATGILNTVRQKQDRDPKFTLRNLTWIGGDAWGDRVREDLLETAHGMLGVIPRTYLSDEFDRHFQSLRPLNSANPWFDEYWETLFNCSLTSQSPEGLQECNVENQAISSDLGYQQSGKVTFTIDAVYAFTHAIHRLQQDYCQGGPGLCEEIVDFRSGGKAIRGDLLLQYLHNVSFNGISTEVVSFDKNGDQQGGYIIKNLQKKSNGKFVREIIGYWDELPQNRATPLEIFGDIQWSDGQSKRIPRSICSHPCGNGEYPRPIASQAECCWVCKPCAGDNTVSTGTVCQVCDRGYIPNDLKTECVLIQPSYLTWSHGWSVAILVLTCIGIIATTSVAIVFIAYNKHQLIKASSRELSAIMLMGILLSYILPFFFIAKPAPWTCAAHRFGVGFCFALCYGALLVKTNRIHRIFNRSPNSNQLQAPPLISSQSQIFFTALLVGVQVVIASVWLIIEKPSVVHIFNKYSTELKCGESFHSGLPVALAYNFILLLVTTYFAFRTRNVPQNFNEAKFINLTVYTLGVLWFAFIPTYYATASLGTAYQTGSLVIVIFLNATVTLCLLFAPKMYYLFFQKQAECQSKTFEGLKHVDKTTVFTSPPPSMTPIQLNAVSNMVVTTTDAATQT